MALYNVCKYRSRVWVQYFCKLLISGELSGYGNTARESPILSTALQLSVQVFGVLPQSCQIGSFPTSTVGIYTTAHNVCHRGEHLPSFKLRLCSISAPETATLETVRPSEFLLPLTCLFCRVYIGDDQLFARLD